MLQVSLRETCPNMEFFPGPYFPVFGLNKGKCGKEKTPYLDPFYAVCESNICFTSYKNALTFSDLSTKSSHCPNF